MAASQAMAAAEHGRDIASAMIEHSAKFVTWPKGFFYTRTD